MDMSMWFRLVIDMADEVQEWNDWSEDGLRRFGTAVKGAVLANLMTTQYFPYSEFRRHSDQFILWAVRWLSDPAGRAVPHV